MEFGSQIQSPRGKMRRKMKQRKREKKKKTTCVVFFAPRARLELATLRLTAACSTIELPRNIQKINIRNRFIRCQVIP